MDRYKESKSLFHDVEKLENYGKLNLFNGNFEFHHCPHCKGPKLGHKDREEICKNKIEKGELKPLEVEEVDRITTKLQSVHKDMFAMKLAMLDTRASQIHWDGCDHK